jgi:hypothetical protein
MSATQADAINADLSRLLERSDTHPRDEKR